MCDIRSLKFWWRALIFSAGILFLYACEDIHEADISVSIARSEVSCDAGSHLVTVTASGDWALTMYSEDGDVDWAELSETQGTGNNGRIVLSYDSNESENSRSLMLILTSAGRDASCTFLQNGVPVENPNPGGEPDGPSSIPSWMELPAMNEDDELTFVSHSMSIGGVRTRNYSLYWDDSHRVAHWVAYPLSTWNMSGSVGRAGDWDFDPSISSSRQPDFIGGGIGSQGYDRGHQIPSNDRQANYDANDQTFYMTNLTPQLPSFNQNIWANFELKVHSLAERSDTMYVVTGCIVEDGGETIRDNSGKRVSVPVAYFKALLRYARNSTIGYSNYAGAAFYLEHRSYTETNVTQEMSMSIDDLEDLTGIDFFVNLPDAIGESVAARVEAQQPSTVNWWW